MARLLSSSILLLIVLLFACNKSTDTALSSRRSILAQVNGKRITLGEFDQKWSALPDVLKAVYSGPNGKKDFLEELITRELLLQKAREMKLDQDAAFKEHVEAFGERLLLDAILSREIEKKADVTDGEIEAYFEAHRDALPAVEEVRAAHILVKTEGEAGALLDRLRRGADFAALAKANSIDPGTKDKGGNLGVVRKGRMVPEFEKMAFALKPGQISDVVKTPYGYHIIRVQSRQAVKPRKIDEARNEIRQDILKDKQKTLFDALAKKLRAEARIAVSDPVRASLGTEAESK